MCRVLPTFILALVLILGSFPPPAFADQVPGGEAKVEITLEQAISRALAQSRALEKAKVKVGDAEDAYDASVAAYAYAVSVNTGTGPAYFARESADFAWESARYTRDLTSDAVALDACGKYFEVLKAMRNVHAREMALKRSEQELAVVHALHGVGMVGRVALDGAAAQVAGARAGLVEAENSLDKAYRSFNQLLGLDEDGRPVLPDLPVFQPLDLDLQTLEINALNNSPTLVTAESALLYLQRVRSINSGDPMRDVGYYEVRSAELDVQDARDATRLLVRSLYNGVIGLEEAYAAAEQSVNIAAENLRIAQLKYQLGMVTKKDVLAAEADLAAAEQKLFDLTTQHTYLKLALAKPWVPGTP